MKGEKLIADVYNALRTSPLWTKTLLVVVFDEHGGFFDHVPPPAAEPPDDHTQHFAFDRLGVRVPAILISPWLARGVTHSVFDHTSLLRYLTDKWHLGPLGRRVEKANSIALAMMFLDAARTDTPPFIRVRNADLYAPHPELEMFDRSKHHEAFGLFADHLERLRTSVASGAPDGQVRTRRSDSWIDAVKRAAGRLMVRWGTALAKRASDTPAQVSRIEKEVDASAT